MDWGQWTQIPDYPYGSAINQAPVIALNSPETFIVFGGYDKNLGRPISTISKFSVVDNEWSIVGDLLTARQGHGAVERDGSFWVVG